ncbi:hypothetical protein ACFQY4_13110 [Catellatospora bangladeshensis]|uniref:hypothetical protein n=1 Tax=Catellatospora bangladeshensis TaxID=310355 RepID=UPI00360E4B7D
MSPSPPHRRRLVVAVTLLALLSGTPAAAGPNTAAGAEYTRARPADNAATGMIWSGLAADRSGPCAGLYRVAGLSTTMCTHGPDPAPAGLDIKRSVAPLPQRAATAAAPSALAVCEGDGTSGRRVEVLYVHGTTNRYSQYVETFRQLAEQVDVIFNESAKATGGERHVRYVTENVNGACRPVVRDVQIADSALNANDWAPLLNAVKAAGYTRTDRKYLQFVDARVYCGIGGFAGDTRKSDANRSNTGPEYARADSGCWTAGVAAHELGHTLGAVNNNAPNASGAAHCVDEYDVMCYKDSDGVVLRYSCPSQALDNRLDCNHDDYYHTSPPAGSYLATYYNVADNLFLIKGGGTTPPPPSGNLALSAAASASYTSPGRACWRSTTASTRRRPTTPSTAAGAPGPTPASSGRS